MLNRTMRMSVITTLSTSLLLTTPTYAKPPFRAEQSIENKIDSEMVHKKLKMDLINGTSPIQEQYKKDKAESDRIKAEKEAKRQKELEEQKRNEPQWQTFILTFYSSSISENSSAGAVTCQGKKLQPYMVANNVYSLGTRIYLEGYGNKIVEDRGSNKHFGTSNRLDVYIEKYPNESESQYLKRVRGYGVKKVRGYVVK